MECKHCNSPKTRILETRQRLGYLYRRRECADCKKTFGTRQYLDIKDKRK